MEKPKLKFNLADNQKELLEQKVYFEERKVAAKEVNPECAAGGCGGRCGTEDCSKKIQGILNQINKALRQEEEK